MEGFSTKDFNLRNLLSSLVNAFSTFTRVPMPQKRYSQSEVKYTLALFPFVGLLSGLAVTILFLISKAQSLSPILWAVASYALSHYLSGYIHLDGFADTTDALHSHREKEEKLRIMHDPHIGPMAVISLIFHALIAIAAGAEIYQRTVQQFPSGKFIVGLIFLPVMLRSFSIALLIFKPLARKDGMAAEMSKGNDNSVKLLLIALNLFATIILSVFASWVFLLLWLLLLLVMELFSRSALKNFGGLTGDLSGYFFCLAENLSLLFLCVSLLF